VSQRTLLRLASVVLYTNFWLFHQVETTQEKIDYEKLKIEEKILFFASLVLWEDELADNGAAVLSTKCVRLSVHMSITQSVHSSVCLSGLRDNEIMCFVTLPSHQSWPWRNWLVSKKTVVRSEFLERESALQQTEVSWLFERQYKCHSDARIVEHAATFRYIGIRVYGSEISYIMISSQDLYIESTFSLIASHAERFLYTAEILPESR